jgi:hypothetical protein
MNKEEAIELMKERGYTSTAHNGDGSVIWFMKPTKNNICLHAEVRLSNTSVQLDAPGNLKLGFNLLSGHFDINHKEFEKYEEQLYRYALACSKDKPEESAPKTTTEERANEFWKQIVKYVSSNPELPKKYPRGLCTDFHRYWTETSENGKVMRKEKQSTFSISGRLATWLKIEQEKIKGRKSFQDQKAEKQNKDVSEKKKIIDKKEMF